jgi:hypothetical protein
MQNPLNKGNVLVVLDPTDLTKSCLLNADSLIRASDTLRKLYEEAKDKSAGCVSDQDLTCLLVLSSTAAGHSFLVTKALDAPIASILPAQAENQHPPAEAAKARHANASAAKVKKEAAQGKSTTTTSAPVSRIDWPKAYLSFLCLVIGSKKIHGISKSDFGLALPQIEVIINAAFRYSMIGSLQSAFQDFFYGYQRTFTFYETIAKAPMACIANGIILRDLHLFEEAFKHLVGQWQTVNSLPKFQRLLAPVKMAIERRAFELLLKRAC